MHVPEEPTPASFAETALKMSGKSDDEARRTGALDRADDEVERLFRAEHQTQASPLHRAVWERAVPVELFAAPQVAPRPEVAGLMNAACDIVRARRDSRTLYAENGQVSPETLVALAATGYWGLLIDPAFGGAGARFGEFAPFLTRMATLDPTVAGLASVHGCIGAVDPLAAFGSEVQKRTWLPRLARGERLSAFALTEPGAGSDLTALRTTAVRAGDELLITGEKLFITNARPGGILGLVCLFEGRPAVVVCELPEAEGDTFRFRDYGLHALRHTPNRGLVFANFRVPAANLLAAPRGNGLAIAYHGLNRGRVALCANAAGVMRSLLAGMLPWAHYRRTYGEAIARRELVRRRLARLAALITGCDALTAWCAGLLDTGFRGEMECIVAKVFAGEALREAAIELCMKTHGGRAFLHGHSFGDNVHEFLAPSIYEGEGEVLGLALFKSLVKQHGTQFFEPLGHALAAAGIRRPNFFNPSHLWRLRKPLAQYAAWLAHRRLRPLAAPRLPELPAALALHARWACGQLQGLALEISAALRKHQLKLADRQCRMALLSQRLQQATTLLCTALYAGQSSDSLTQAAGNLLCQDLRRALTGEPITDSYLRAASELGEQVAAGRWSALANVAAPDILMPYAT